MLYIDKIYRRPSEVAVKLMRCGIIPMLFLVCSCSDELDTLDEQTPEEREEELRLRTQGLAERWIAHEEKQKPRKLKPMKQ